MIFYKKRKWKPPSKKEKRAANPTGLSPRNKKACDSISTALLQSVAKIRTQSTTQSNKNFVARIIAARPLKTVDSEYKEIDERHVPCGHDYHMQ
jgi:hypothetical protein